MANKFTIDGLNDCYAALDAVPAQALKLTKKTLREAAKPVAKQIRQGTPSRWRKLIRTKMSKQTSIKGGMSVTVGLFNGHQQSGKDEAFDWFKAYWANYGTLKHRDPSHEFQYKVKPKTSRRRNNEGQPAQNFFENASTGAEKKFLDSFVKSFKAHEAELLKK